MSRTLPYACWLKHPEALNIFKVLIHDSNILASGNFYSSWKKKFCKLQKGFSSITDCRSSLHTKAILASSEQLFYALKAIRAWPFCNQTHVIKIIYFMNENSQITSLVNFRKCFSHSQQYTFITFLNVLNSFGCALNKYSCKPRRNFSYIERHNNYLDQSDVVSFTDFSYTIEDSEICFIRIQILVVKSAAYEKTCSCIPKHGQQSILLKSRAVFKLARLNWQNDLAHFKGYC